MAADVWVLQLLEQNSLERGMATQAIMTCLMEPFVYYLFEGFVGLDSIHALHLHTHSGWVGK